MNKLLYIFNEWFAAEIPPFIRRDFTYNILNTRNIVSIVGVRRCGKTYLMYQLIDGLKEKVPHKNLIYINFEDDRLSPLDGSELSSLLNVYLQNFSPDPQHNIYLFLDEVQNVKGWEKTLRRIHDKNPKVSIVISGSSSKLLSSEIATSLRGRTLTFELYPFSFRSFLETKDVSIGYENIEFSPQKDLVIRCLKEYFEYGGFPKVVLEEKEKTKILEEYYRAIFYRDIIERYEIRNIRLFEDFLKTIIQSSSSLFSYGKAVNFLKSVGHRVSKGTLIEYMKYIESAFLAFEVPILSRAVKDQLQYPRKIYSIDTGLKNAVCFRTGEDMGKMAENIVFLELKRRGDSIYYWKDAVGHEVDFIIRKGLKVDKLIQVAWNIDEKVQKREERALFKAMEMFDLKDGEVLTEDLLSDRKVGDKTIHYMPLWKWLLKDK